MRNIRNKKTPKSQLLEILFEKKTVSMVIAIIISVVAFAIFLINTDLIKNPLLIIAISIFILFPFKKSTTFTRYYLVMVVGILVCWLLSNIGSTLFSFIFALLTGYLLNPLVVKLEGRGLQRWLSTTIIMVIFCGIIVTIGIFIFPSIFLQLETIVNTLSKYVNNVPEYLKSEKIFAILNKFGISREVIDTTIKYDILPQIEKLVSVIFNSLLQIFLSFSTIATHIVNIVIMPFLMFYFLKDFNKIRSKIGWVLKKENIKLYKYVSRFDKVLRIYIGWQITASGIVITISSIVFSIFSLPYGILFAFIAGFLNPIPYFGSILSIVISSCVLILVNDGNTPMEILVIVCTIMGIHFINSYLIEPTIAGGKVGLHPVLMILSVFIFSSLFGIIGMLIAVPISAVIATIIQDVINEHYGSLKFQQNSFINKNDYGNKN